MQANLDIRKYVFFCDSKYPAHGSPIGQVVGRLSLINILASVFHGNHYEDCDVLMLIGLILTAKSCIKYLRSKFVGFCVHV